jgi:hypothetical protein
MPEILRLDGLLVKKESVYMSDPTPSASTDGVRISRRLWSSITLDYAWENSRLDVASGSIVPPKDALPRGRRARVDIFWECKGKGSDATPEAADLYQACGLPETDGANLFDYGPVADASHASATLYCYAGGLLFKVVGCRGHFRWPLTVGQVATHQFTMFGLVTTDPATTTLPAIAGYDATEPIAGVNTALTIGSWIPDWLAGELDLQGSDPQMLPSGNATDGIAGFDFGVVDPMFRLTARKVALATFDPYADHKARTSRTLAMTFGATQFSRVKVVGATVSLRAAPAHADSEGFANWDLQYRVEAGGTIRFD